MPHWKQRKEGLACRQGRPPMRGAQRRQRPPDGPHACGPPTIRCFHRGGALLIHLVARHSSPRLAPCDTSSQMSAAIASPCVRAALARPLTRCSSKLAGSWAPWPQRQQPQHDPRGSVAVAARNRLAGLLADMRSEDVEEESTAPIGKPLLVGCRRRRRLCRQCAASRPPECPQAHQAPSVPPCSALQ